MEFKLLNSSMIASQNEKGEWIYKSNDEKKAPFKKDGTLKAQYRDLPRYKAIIQYENILIKEYQKTVIEESVKQMTNKLLSFTK